MARFIGGLEPSIAEKVDIQPYWSFENACKLAIKVEKHSKRKGLFDHSYTKSAAPLNPNKPPKSDPTPKEAGGRAKGKAIIKEFPKNLMARDVLSAMGMAISKLTIRT